MNFPQFDAENWKINYRIISKKLIFVNPTWSLMVAMATSKLMDTQLTLWGSASTPSPPVRLLWACNDWLCLCQFLWLLIAQLHRAEIRDENLEEDVWQFRQVSKSQRLHQESRCLTSLGHLIWLFTRVQIFYWFLLNEKNKAADRRRTRPRFNTFNISFKYYLCTCKWIQNVSDKYINF